MKEFLTAYWHVAAAVLFLAGWILSRLVRPGSDIDRKKLDPDIKWDAAGEESLNKLYDYVIAVSETTILWYQSRRRPKRVWGVILRVGALVATAAAGVVPLAGDLFNVKPISPVWSTVLVAAAGVFVSVDAIGGFTSGWVRYMLAQQTVERLRDVFMMEWNALKEAKASVGARLERSKAFLLAVGKVVDEETQEWATEFQNALKEMEKARRAAAETQRSGAVEVIVKNYAQVAGGWTLEIDGNQRGRTSGKSIAVTDVAVGIRKIRAYGQDAQGKTLSDERTVKVDGGVTVPKELELA